jgi:hypothetical protein
MHKRLASRIRESMEESVALMVWNMRKDFQNFIGRHFSIYTKRAAIQIISQLTGLPKDNALVHAAGHSAALRLSPPFAALVLPFTLPNPHIVAAAINQLRREVSTYNWGRFPPNANLEHYIINNCAVLGNDLVEYFRLLRTTFRQHGGSRFFQLCPCPSMQSLHDRAILELITTCCDS